ncbi:peroxiredoxin [Sedimentibacter acidaminivorans]|jgi:peroxiredoxin|uniref:Peroxiredoxin n=1 Tax=Sedimentibacter acidaminivorans TaxID=913099 RepID=A0ABS4GAI7_9FIRM|nr:redoxin domain-containing protein [Sedimentibacter acidaminivorans]MBP1924693.1 peroxiredoxin [Sedimentibacter acidaminivorans]
MKKIFIMLLIIAFVTVGCNTNNRTNETTNQNEQQNNQVTEDTQNSDVTSTDSGSTNTNDTENKIIMAPDFELKSLDGTITKLSDLKGKNVIINFWATWCDFCIAEMPDLQKLQDEYKDEDLLILAVNVGETKEEVEKFIEENNLNLTILLDKDGVVSNSYGVSSFPSTLAVNKDGEVVVGHVGMLTYEQMETLYGYFNK